MKLKKQGSSWKQLLLAFSFTTQVVFLHKSIVGSAEILQNMGTQTFDRGLQVGGKPPLLPGSGCITNGNNPNCPPTRPKLAPTKPAPIKSPPTKPLMTLAKPAPTSVRSAPMKPLKPLKVPAKPLASP